ncbi:hypothetical protein DSLASN_44000 [Desulfoluna limicola]|uniref:Hint domain-containing protein n=1 Tax=Desulfoluna limicola TaxID=2810562 RepID=A0ABM7PND0_9BACT|nr:RHS repeat-associated core domain-containing protein [Desulfoluna limicola]BCS98768.1 hypothetical protein DSLASN_44000 [Desulfoluna limicola]
MLPIRKLTYFLLLLSISFLAGCEIEGYFRAEPDTIIRGESATLIWDLEQYSAQADSASIEPEIGSVRVNGSYLVRPDETTTYTITWTGKDLSGKEGTATEKTTVTVIQPPECSLEASSDTVIEGEPITLLWTSKNADSYVIDPHVGDVDPEGWRVVYPAGDTTYTLKVSGPGGTEEASVSITTRPSITVTEPDGVRDYSHQSFTVRWADVDTDENAEISIYYDTGNIGADGALIADGIYENQDSTYDTAIWNTEQVPEGSYYIYAVIDDGKTEPVIVYSDFKVIVDHHSPRFNDISPKSVTELNTLSFYVSANDPNSDPLTFSAANFPEGVSFNSSTGNFSWTPSLGQVGTYNVQFSVTDGVNTDTVDVEITVNKHPVSVTLNANPESIKCGEPTVLSWSSIYAESYTIEPDVGVFTSEGIVSVSPSAPTTYTITATGESGTATDSVTVGINPPEVTISSDVSEIQLQYGQSAKLTWSTSCADSCVIEPEVGENLLNGSAVVTPDYSTEYTITATGPGGTTQKSVIVKVVGPPMVKLSVSQSEIIYGEPVILNWAVKNVSPRPFINQGIGSVEPVGSRELKPDYTTTYAISASNEDKSVFHTITVRVVGSPPPESLSEGSFGEKYQDLVPGDASLESYDEKRFVILTGTVNEINDTPLSGVRVEVFDHPEYGSVLTDSEGRFSIPADGGGVLKLVYTKEDYITSHRQQETSWNDVVIFDPIALVQKDPIETIVTFDGNPGTIITHKSTKIIDPEFGDRSCTMVFTGDNMAYEMDKYGNVIRPLSTITTRATEFTTPESMPSILPPLSAYTYCSELEVDGVERVKFDKPVIVYVDNFLDFPVGGIVPVGYYDRDKGQWIPSENGVVVELLDMNSDGAVDALDSDGDGYPDDLDQDGLYSDEIEGLEESDVYTPGTTYWRVSVNHFTPDDFNWPYGLPRNAISPNPDGEPSSDSDDSECFAEGTVVQSPHGFTPIEQLSEGDHVWSFDEKTGEKILNQISRIYATPDRNLLELTFQGAEEMLEIIRVTPEHPFMVSKRGWTSAEELSPGDLIVSFGGKTITFKSRRQGPEAEIVYNLEVENTHCYFVGESGLLVHNACTGNVDHKKRVLHQDIPIAGTDMPLHYASNRVVNEYKQKVTVPVSGGSVPDSLVAIQVNMDIAGKRFSQTLSALPSQKAEFVYDNRDFRERVLSGRVDAKISIGFVYKAVYKAPWRDIAFGQSGGDSYTWSRARQEITLWRRATLPVYIYSKGANHELSDEIAEGWSLSSQHQVNPSVPSTLYKGDGTTIQNNISIISTVAGTGVEGYNGDGIPAVEAQLRAPRDIAIGPQGNLFICDSYSRVRKVDKNGIITTVAGGGTSGSTEDGIPAVEAYLSPLIIALDPQGNLFIADRSTRRIRKVDTNGIITTVGGEDVWGARDIPLYNPTSIAIDMHGNLYIADTFNRIRKVDTNGIITQIAGIGDVEAYLVGGYYTGEGIPAVEAYLDSKDIALDSQGNLFIAEPALKRIRKVDSNGIITTVAGIGFGVFNGDGIPAVEASLFNPDSIAIDPQGNLFIYDGYYRIRKVDTNGIITTMAGTGICCYNGEGIPAVEAALSRVVSDIAVNHQGTVFVAGERGHRVRKICSRSSFFNGTSIADIPFADENGLGYIMASNGRHKETIDLETGKTLLKFDYDENNLYITDHFGKQVEIVYQDDVPVEIIAPYGVVTKLGIEDNQLKTVTYPDDSYYEFGYTDEGLMEYAVDPEKNRFDYSYNDIGRLTDVFDSEDGHWDYARTAGSDGSIEVAITSVEGNQITSVDHKYSTGKFTSKMTRSTGDVTDSEVSADKLRLTSTALCGMDLSLKYGLDPEHKARFVKEMTLTTTSGLAQTTLRDKIYEDMDTDSIPGLITETITTNSKPTKIVHNVLTATKTVTTPENRTVTSSYDKTTLLPTNISVEGLNDVTYTYYPAGHLHYGRLHYVTSGTRKTEYIYDDDGNLHAIIGPDLKETIFEEYDLMGRVKLIRRPDKTTVGFEYDNNGNMTALVNPSNKRHGFGFNGVDLRDTYTTPHPRGYSYKYDRDRRLTHIYFPSEKEIFFDYDDGHGNKSLLREIITPEDIISYTYACGSKVGTITKDTESLTWGYDDDLVTSTTSNGILSQAVSYRYDNDGDFTMDGLTYAGKTYELSYDNDGLLTGSGDYTVTRKPENGLPDAVTGGVLSLYRSFNGYGEIDGVASTVGGVNAASWAVTDRDNAGRIKEKTETVDGVTDTYSYDYDDNGRLETVTKNGTLVEEYGYSKIPYGTCTVRTNTLRGITAQDLHYDEEDRLLSIGETSYFYDEDGFLESKVKGDETTTYTYSSRGELLSVALPYSRIITYLHDPLGRRIAKQVNGVITEKYLWEGLTTLLAVFDGSDNLIMRFEYADDRMPISMTKGSDTYTLLYDQVGTLRAVSDSSGNIVKQGTYDTFGYVLSDTNDAFTVPFGFAGGLHDRDTGLVRFGYRDYDPESCRWTAKDPILFEGGDTDLYGYVLDDPVNLVDPEGLHGLILSKPPTYFRPINRLTPNQRFTPRPIPRQTPKPELIRLERYMPPVELEKTWWGEFLETLSNLLDWGGGGAIGVGGAYIPPSGNNGDQCHDDNNDIDTRGVYDPVNNPFGYI